MFKRFAIFFLLIWTVLGHSWELSGNLDDEQVILVTLAVSDLSSTKRTTILTLGIVENAIKKLNLLHPQLDIIALDSITYTSHLFDHKSTVWKSNTAIAWENQYDAIVIYLALEKDPHREQKLRIMHKALKPEKRGIIICAPSDVRSVDSYAEQCVASTEWETIVSTTPNLSSEAYRILIQNIGFAIVHEGTWLSVLRNLDPFDWIGNRWAVPLPMRPGFVSDVSRLLRKTYGDELWWFPNLCSFVVEK
jgi:hypothetical protein